MQNGPEQALVDTVQGGESGKRSPQSGGILRDTGNDQPGPRADLTRMPGLYAAQQFQKAALPAAVSAPPAWLSPGAIHWNRKPFLIPPA